MGTFEFGQKIIYLRDPETIKQMVIKDFDHFEDHRGFIDDTVNLYIFYVKMAIDRILYIFHSS